MEHPRRNSLLLLPAFLLLAATACQESLPPFPEPGIELSARIVLDSRIETFGTPWPFLVEVLNVSDPQGTDAFILPPPFSVSGWVRKLVSTEAGKGHGAQSASGLLPCLFWLWP